MSREFEERACARSSRRTPDAMQRGGPGSLTRDEELRQKAEGRRRKAEGRRQKAEGRRQKDQRSSRLLKFSCRSRVGGSPENQLQNGSTTY